MSEMPQLLDLLKFCPSVNLPVVSEETSRSRIHQQANLKRSLALAQHPPPSFLFDYGSGGVGAISQGRVCLNPGFGFDFYNLSSFGYPFQIIQ